MATPARRTRGSTRARAQAIEELRYRLPLQLYLKTLHDAAVYGHVEEYDGNARNPRLTGKTRAVSTRLQLEAAESLTDRLMPKLKSVPAPEEDALDVQRLSSNNDSIANLSDEDLLRLQQGDVDEIIPIDAEFAESDSDSDSDNGEDEQPSQESF